MNDLFTNQQNNVKIFLYSTSPIMNNDLVEFKHQIVQSITSQFFMNVDIEQCDGFFTFVDVDGDVVQSMKNPVVFVNHLTDLDVNQWVDEFVSKINQS